MVIGSVLYGVLFASKPAVQVLGNPFVGKLVDRRGPGGPIFVGLLIVVASTLLFGLSASRGHCDGAAPGTPAHGGATACMDHGGAWVPPHYGELLAARLVQGLGSCSIMAGGMAAITLTHGTGERGGAMGTAMAGVALGVLMGPVAGGVLSSGSLHRSGTSAGFRCPNQRSRHALPVRPGSAHDTADHAFTPCVVTAPRSDSSSSVDHDRRGMMAALRELTRSGRGWLQPRRCRSLQLEPMDVATDHMMPLPTPTVREACWRGVCDTNGLRAVPETTVVIVRSEYSNTRTFSIS